MNRDELSFALNETTHALRFAQSAAKRFQLDVEHWEAGLKTTTSVIYGSNRLLDAVTALSDAELEINLLIRDSKTD